MSTHLHFQVSLAVPSLKTCHILEVSTTAAQGKIIKVGCDGKSPNLEYLTGCKFYDLDGTNGQRSFYIQWFQKSAIDTIN